MIREKLYSKQHIFKPCWKKAMSVFGLTMEYQEHKSSEPLWFIVLYLNCWVNHWEGVNLFIWVGARL